MCPEHKTAPVKVEEQNYFFALSSWGQQVQAWLEAGKVGVIPRSRLNEVLAFVRRGLTDFSISRAAERSGGWGTAVPEDESQVVYVWVDALINYVSALGLGSGDAWRDWWNEGTEKVHVIGKNVWKFHAIYWPALLASAGLALPDRVVVHGFLTVDGQKIGKSLGNAVDPFACIERLGCDGLRYYLLRAIPSFGDGDFSLARAEELYRTDLANGLGNLVSRLAKLCQTAGLERVERPAVAPAWDGVGEAIGACEFDRALAAVWEAVTDLNRQIENVRPWELIRSQQTEEARRHLGRWLWRVRELAWWLRPFLPAGRLGGLRRSYLKVRSGWGSRCFRGWCSREGIMEIGTTVAGEMDLPEGWYALPERKDPN